MGWIDSNETCWQVKKGDTLWGIAEAKWNDGTKYKQLASWNKIPNPDYIQVGQKIYTYDYSDLPNTSNSTQMVTIKQFGQLSGDDPNNNELELFATWGFNNTNATENYKVQWKYKNIIEMYGVDTTTDYMYSTYKVPDKAKYVKFRVKPIAKKDDDGKLRYDSTWTEWKTYNVITAPDAPGTPNVSMEGVINASGSKSWKLTANLENITNGATLIHFEVAKDDTITGHKSAKIDVTKTSTASTSWNVEAGGKYKVRYRGYKDGLYGEWSSYSTNVESGPAKVSKFSKCEPRSESSIYLEWGAANGATSYDIQYSNKKENFDKNSLVSDVTGITNTCYEVTGLESGNEYFFRIKGVKGQESSEWSEISSATIGTGPAVPTTWSSTTTAIIGEDENVTLYWVHNSEDGSSQKYAEVELYIENISDINKVVNSITVPIGTIDATKTVIDTGINKIFYHINNTEDEKEKDKTHSLIIHTLDYDEGAKIKWRIRTAGITGVQSEEWSILREIDIYTKPTLNLSITDSEGNAVETLTAFPLNIRADLEGFNSDIHHPIGYHVTIAADESYETLDYIGNPKTVNASEMVYSKYFDNPQSEESIFAVLNPSDVDLENGISYTLNCIVSMSSGITVESFSNFSVSWTDAFYSPTAEIAIDADSYVAYIRPYCAEYTKTYHKVERQWDGKYQVTGEIIDVDYLYGDFGDGDVLKGILTDTGEQVYTTITDDGSIIHFCERETETIIENVTFSVYRREFDGSFTELAVGLRGSDYTFITDPHPPLDYARYRIVAIDDATGSVSFHDTPSHPVGVKSIIIQWDEQWTNFDAKGNNDIERPAWSGSLLKFPYNVDVSERNSRDVSLVKYIGRKHPVSYYGTQVGTAHSWSSEIEKNDKETIYGLRRLQAWMGDVYVREPSGIGYWASITVSFDQKHCDLTVPVTFDIVRVEGGM